MSVILLSNAPSNSQEALDVLRKEVEYRQTPKLLAMTKDVVNFLPQNCLHF